MVSRLGVIPAAGCASRFGGIDKELLPARDGLSFLQHAVRRLQPYTDKILLITNPQKVECHVKALGGEVLYAIQRTRADIWGAILEALEFDADEYLFTMPDTLLPEDAFAHIPAGQFSLGTFVTDNPARYGVIVEGKVINKNAHLPTPALAWGVLHWTRPVVQAWHALVPETYTQAINYAIDQFGLHTWDIGSYHDNASIADYLEYMHS